MRSMTIQERALHIEILKNLQDKIWEGYQTLSYAIKKDTRKHMRDHTEEVQFDMIVVAEAKIGFYGMRVQKQLDIIQHRIDRLGMNI